MKVSIIVPIYNVEKYLAECLASALRQTLEDIEIICVNDCSTDRSVDIINEYAERDRRIKIIHNERNRGLSYSRNQGLKIAEGKYICFLDADDMLTDTALQELYDKAEEMQTDVIFFDAKMLIESDKVLEKDTAFCSKISYPEIMSGVDFFRKMQEANDLRVPVWLQFWNKVRLYKMNLQFLEGILHEDNLFTYQALMKAKRVLCIQKVYYIYRRHDDSITLRGTDERYLVSMLEIYQQILEYWHQYKGQNIDEVSEKYLLAIRGVINTYIKELGKSEEEMRQILGQNSIYEYWYDILNDSGEQFIRAKKIVWLAKFPKVYIYGAGQASVGRVMLLQKYDVSIDGILVTDPHVNPPYFMDIPVYGVDSILGYKDDCAVVIGVGRKLRVEVMEKLSDLGISNIVEFN